MKTIKYIIAGAVLAGSMLGGMSLTSCSDLDEHGYTFIDPSSFYNTEEEIDATLIGVYNRYRNMYNANSQLYLAQIELLADQAVPTYNKNNMELQNINEDIFPKERQGGSSNYFNQELINSNNKIKKD